MEAESDADSDSALVAPPSPSRRRRRIFPAAAESFAPAGEPASSAVDRCVPPLCTAKTFATCLITTPLTAESVDIPACIALFYCGVSYCAHVVKTRVAVVDSHKTYACFVAVQPSFGFRRGRLLLARPALLPCRLHGGDADPA